MWGLILKLAARLAMVRWLFKVLGGLGLLVPLAFLLKIIGIPVLLVLAVLALPVLFMLFIFGLPIFLVLMVGGALLGLLGAVLAAGMMALKVAIFVVLPIWLLWKLVSWMFGRRSRPATNGGDVTP